MPQIIIGFANTGTPAEKKKYKTASQETLSYLQTKIVA